MTDAPYPGPRDTDTPDGLQTPETPETPVAPETPEGPATPAPAPSRDDDNPGDASDDGTA